MTTDETTEKLRAMATHPAAKLVFEQWLRKDVFGGREGGKLHSLVRRINDGEITAQQAAAELTEKHIKATPWRGGDATSRRANVQRDALIQLRDELQELVDMPEYHTQDEAVIALHLRGEQNFAVAVVTVLNMDREQVTALIAEQVEEHVIQTARWMKAARWYDRNVTSLESLAEVRELAADTHKKATAMLRAAVVNRLQHGDAETVVARRAGVDRMTVRAWAGKRS